MRSAKKHDKIIQVTNNQIVMKTLTNKQLKEMGQIVYKLEMISLESGIPIKSLLKTIINTVKTTK